MSGKVQTRVERRAELVEQILDILRPQLDGQPVVSNNQRAELQAAIAHFTSEVREE